MAKRDSAATIREALERLLSALRDYHENAIEHVGMDMMQVLADPINMAQYAICESSSSTVLSKPPRNCDVGTAQEQYGRWKNFCNSNWNSANAADGLDPCDDCPLVDCGADGSSFGCQFAWAQRPYNKEVYDDGNDYSSSRGNTVSDAVCPMAKSSK